MSNRKSLLEIVQDILSALNDDEINSIHDTTRAHDVAKLVRDAYLELTAFEHIPELKKLTQLKAASNNNYPAVLSVPEDVNFVYKIRYNTNGIAEEEDCYTDVCYLSPMCFMDRLSCNKETENHVKMLVNSADEPESPHIWVRNNKHPSYWTSFDDVNILFDSWNSEVEDTLQNKNSLALVSHTPAFKFQDSFKIPVDLKTLVFLTARAKNLAFDIYKGYVPQELVRSERKAKATLNHVKGNFEKYPDWSAFGRRT